MKTHYFLIIGNRVNETVQIDALNNDDLTAQIQAHMKRLRSKGAYRVSYIGQLGLLSK